MKTNAQYNIIIGQRSNGKTYAVLEYLITEYCKNGSEFAIIRRWLDDIKGRRGNNIFSALEENSVIQKATNGQWTGIAYKSMQFYFKKYEDGKLILSETPIGYAFAISQMEHDKSSAYPRVKNILFDEFITRDDFGYLNNEFILFMNTLSTIIRERGEIDNIKIFMCGNTVNFSCPYFSEMGLTNIKNQKQGTIDVYEYGESDLKVAVEYSESFNSKINSNKYYAFNNPRLKMITGDDGGSWEIGAYPHLPFKYAPKNVIFIYFIIFENTTLQCEIIEKDNIIITFVHKKTSDIKNPDADIIFTPDYDPRLNWSQNLFNAKIPKIRELISKTFNLDMIFYQDNETGEYMRNYIQYCTKTKNKKI